MNCVRPLSVPAASSSAYQETRFSRARRAAGLIQRIQALECRLENLMAGIGLPFGETPDVDALAAHLADLRAQLAAIEAA